MKILLFSLCIAITCLIVLFPWLIRTIARIATDKMLCGKKTPTSKCINRCIRVLTWSNKWITNNEVPDQSRINRLNLMLKKIQNPNG